MGEARVAGDEGEDLALMDFLDDAGEPPAEDEDFMGGEGEVEQIGRSIGFLFQLMAL